MTSWLAQNYIEILGAILSMVYLYFSIRQNILLWPLGIISAAIYVLVFFQSKFYADMGVNVYYLLISIYGWSTWAASKKRTGRKMPVANIPMKTAVVATVFFLLMIMN